MNKKTDRRKFNRRVDVSPQLFLERRQCIVKNGRRIIVRRLRDRRIPWGNRRSRMTERRVKNYSLMFSNRRKFLNDRRIIIRRSGKDRRE